MVQFIISFDVNAQPYGRFRFKSDSSLEEGISKFVERHSVGTSKSMIWFLDRGPTEGAVTLWKGIANLENKSRVDWGFGKHSRAKTPILDIGVLKCETVLQKGCYNLWLCEKAAKPLAG
jgi:hypothetical protein